MLQVLYKKGILTFLMGKGHVDNFRKGDRVATVYFLKKNKAAKKKKSVFYVLLDRHSPSCLLQQKSESFKRLFRKQ